MSSAVFLLPVVFAGIACVSATGFTDAQVNTIRQKLKETPIAMHPISGISGTVAADDAVTKEPSGQVKIKVLVSAVRYRSDQVADATRVNGYADDDRLPVKLTFDPAKPFTVTLTKDERVDDMSSTGTEDPDHDDVWKYQNPKQVSALKTNAVSTTKTAVRGAAMKALDWSNAKAKEQLKKLPQ